MRTVLLVAMVLGLYINASGQVPINMSFQPSLTHLTNFDSIASWSNGFASGYGSGHFASVSPTGTATIPNATRITTSSTAFVTGSTGGVYRDTVNDRIVMLVTGTTNN